MPKEMTNEEVLEELRGAVLNIGEIVLLNNGQNPDMPLVEYQASLDGLRKNLNALTGR